MKILKEGRAHQRYAWFCTCKFCDSKLRIIQGDPMATEEVGYQCDRGQYYIRYICPVCRGRNVAYTNSSFGEKANAEYKFITLDEEDRKEIASWFTDDGLYYKDTDLTDEEKAYINKRVAP